MASYSVLARVVERSKCQALLLTVQSMGVIYGGTGTPSFWTEGYGTPHLSGQKCEEFSVTCCQQKRSAEIKFQ